ncbi:MAG: hypothetical protein WCI12_11575, partial [Actinomycetes bacterium]
AARLAAIVLSLGSLLGTGGGAGAATPLSLNQATVAAQESSQLAGSLITQAPPRDVSRDPTGATSVSVQTYIVEPGDCLWTIAERLSGDGEAWTQIAAANLGRTMDNGVIFLDPSLILVGWSLVIPNTGTSPLPEPIASESSAPDAAFSKESSTTPRTAPLPHDASPGGVGPVVPRPLSSPLAPHPTQRKSPTMSDASFPTNAAVVVASSLGSGLALLGLLRRRRKRAHGLDPNQADAIVDAEVGLACLEPIPVTTALEGAVLLAAADGALGGIGIMRVDSHGATFFAEGRARWIASGSELLSQPPTWNEAPGLCLPLGEAEAATWALVVPRGGHATLGGSQADRLLDHALALQAEFAWGSMVAIAQDAEEAFEISSLAERGSITVLVGPPTGSETALTEIGVVLIETDPSIIHDITITDGTVEVRSLGVSCAANHLGVTAEALLALPVEASAGVARQEKVPAPDAVAPSFDEGEVTADNLQNDRPSTMVRLLVATPRVEGLSNPIDPKRERRSTELLAYLTLHHPDPTTGDRLRTRVLGSSTTDAAAKTLFNVASAARRALGVDRQGHALLPPASRDGVYRISDAVGCDVDLFAGHLAAARSARSPEEAIAYLRAGLELIEAEPLATVLAGYEWFTAEGHAARLEAQVEQAACLLVDLALAAGLQPLAEWALTRSVLVVPHS